MREPTFGCTSSPSPHLLYSYLAEDIHPPEGKYCTFAIKSAGVVTCDMNVQERPAAQTCAVRDICPSPAERHTHVNGAAGRKNCGVASSVTRLDSGSKRCYASPPLKIAAIMAAVTRYAPIWSCKYSSSGEEDALENTEMSELTYPTPNRTLTDRVRG